MIFQNLDIKNLDYRYNIKAELIGGEMYIAQK